MAGTAWPLREKMVVMLDGAQPGSQRRPRRRRCGRLERRHGPLSARGRFQRV